MGKSSRTKGHSFEREVAQIFREVFPLARRQLEYNETDCNGIDLSGTGRYRIQCKRRKKYANPLAIEEILIGNPAAEIPILITKADRRPTLAIIPLDALIGLIAAREGCGQAAG